MSGRRKDAGSRIVIGLAMIAGSIVLFWLSSTATLILARDASGAVTGTFERHLFGQLAHSRVEVPGIVAVKVERVDAHASEKRGRASERLIFVTRSGPVELGQAQDMFLRQWQVIRAFLEDDARDELTLSSTAGTRESFRFVFAQLVGAFLSLGGMGVVTSGLRSILARGGT